MLLRAGRGRGRDASALHRLGAVALVLLVLRPELADDLGARLSFLAVAGLLAVARLPGGGPVAPVGAFLVTAPLVAETFGRVQPWGLLLTPLLVPLVAAVLALGAVLVLPGALLAGLDPLGGPLLAGAAGLLGRLLEEAALRCPQPLEPGPLPLPGSVAGLLVLGALLALPAALPSRVREATP